MSIEPLTVIAESGVGADSPTRHLHPIHAAFIREFGERLDARRTKQQAEHPTLTISGMYNVREELRKGEALTAMEKVIHEQGLVSVLKRIHDDLDAAIFDAYGLPHDLTNEQILERLIALNAERATEEKRRLIRWLRPDFQAPKSAARKQETLPDENKEEAAPAGSKGKRARPKAAEKPAASKPEKQPWPTGLPERIAAVRSALTRSSTPSTLDDIARHRTCANPLEEVLDSLTALGLALRLNSDPLRWRAVRGAGA